MKKAALFLAFLVGLIMPLNTIGAAYAAPGEAALSVTSEVGFLGATVNVSICNAGDEKVEEFTLHVDTITNFDVDTYIVNPDPASGGTTAEDPGDINSTSGVWSGLVASSECVVVILYGEITGDLGEDISGTFSVTDSVLEGGGPNPNVDLVQGSLAPYEIRLLPDIAVETRLLPRTEDQEADEVSYEIIYHNVGDGEVPELEDTMSVISFIVPDNTTITGVTDLNPSDELASDFDYCFLRAPSDLGTGLTGYTGTVASCLLTRTGDLAPNSSYNFQVNLTVSGEFTSGTTKIYAVGSGQDLDTMLIQRALFLGEDPFVTMLEFNNLSELTYDDSDLVPFVSRCSGQNATTTDGTGCFRISFNKPIWEDSFKIGNLSITAGSIATLSKISDLVWEVRVTGIPKGKTATLSLTEGSVLDYSAISSVKVLGENTIRFDETSTLPATGANDLTPYVIFLLLSGFILMVASRKLKTETN